MGQICGSESSIALLVGYGPLPNMDIPIALMKFLQSQLARRLLFDFQI